jgi:pre-rRNA-processing protein TSR4
MFNSLDPGGTITSQGLERDEESTDSDDECASTSSSASSVVVALASATLADSMWQSAPSYSPQYLSTIGEYIPPSKKAPDELTAGIIDPHGFNQEGHPLASERYENSMHTDRLFDRFNERVTHEPQQCVRYALLRWPVIDHWLM